MYEEKGGGAKQKKGEKRCVEVQQEGKKRRKEEKKMEEPVPVSFWLPNGKILRTRREVAHTSRGRGSLLLWLVLV